MSTSKVSSPLKYSIATFLLCASTLATGVCIYPVGLAIFSSTMIPMLSAAIASVSAMIAMSAAIYLVKANVSAIKARATYNVLEEKPSGDDISTKTPVITTVPLSSPDQDLKEPAANNTKTPEKAPVTFGTAIPQVLQTNAPPPPPPLLGRGANVSPPPPLSSQDLSVSCDLFARIKEGVKLRKVESQSASNVENNDHREDMLKAIRAGVNLKGAKSQGNSEAGVSKQANNQKGNGTSGLRQGGVAQILARRMQVEFSDSESEHSASEADWGDDDQETSYIVSSSKKDSTPKNNHGSGDGVGTLEPVPLQESNITSLEIKSSDNHEGVGAPFIPPPPPLPRQGVNVPPLPLPDGDLNNRKLPKDNDTGEKSLGGTPAKNSSSIEPPNCNEDFQEELKKRLEKRRQKSEHLQDLTRESSAEIKDNKDNAKNKTQEEYVERIEKQQEEVNEVKDQSNDGFIRSIILECIPEPDKIKCTNIKKEGNSGQSSGYSSDLEKDQHPKSTNAMLPQQSPTGSTPATKMDDVYPVDGKAKKTSFFKNPFKKLKKKAEQKTSEYISK